MVLVYALYLGDIEKVIMLCLWELEKVSREGITELGLKQWRKFPKLSVSGIPSRGNICANNNTDYLQC